MLGSFILHFLIMFPMPEVLRSAKQRAANVENIASSEEDGFHFSPLPALTELLLEYFPANESLGHYTPSFPSLHPSPLLRANDFPSLKNKDQRKNRGPKKEPHTSHLCAENTFRFSQGVTGQDVTSFAEAYSNFVEKRKIRMATEEARKFGNT